MRDYIKIYEKFKDIKDIYDLIEEVNKLRYYYQSRQYQNMQEHIYSLTKKYFLETIAWNSANQAMPMTYEQVYINAESFLKMQGAKIILEKCKDLKSRLSEEEKKFINQQAIY